MEYHDLQILLEMPAARLLRSANAAMALGFFYRAFKQQHRVSLPEGQVRAILENYLDDLRENDPNAFPKTAADYLADWCDDAHGFLRKFYGEDREPIFELTAGTEKALLWIETVRGAEFVGTESRLEAIFDGLDTILEFVSGDGEERIRRLLAEQVKIDAEIAKIRTTGRVETFTPVQVNERFNQILTIARELLGDFRQVEENFKRIAQEIAERHTLPGVTKGAVVGHMLDSYDALQESSQGQSFYAFWKLLLSPDRQEHFRKTVEQVYALGSLSTDLGSNKLLRHLIPRLLDEGEKVVDSNTRMSANLRRVLDMTHLHDRRRVVELIREVQALAFRVKERPPTAENFIEVEDHPDLFGSFSRQLWQQSEMVELSGLIEDADSRISLADLRRFRNLPQIRLRELRNNVEACLQDREYILLPQVLAAFPPANGLIEVLGYVLVATQEKRHFVTDQEYDRIVLSKVPLKAWEVPRVLFNRR